jgi:hypothetical protein
VILIIISSGVAFADSTIKIDELGVTIYPPEDFIMITRDTPPDDKAFKKIGADGVTFLENIKNSDIYICFISQDQMSEIIVTMEQNSSSKSIFDFNLLSDKQLEEFANELMDMNSEDILKSAKKNNKEKSTYKELDLSNYVRYEHDQAIFVVLDSYAKIDGKSVYGRQYTTIINGQSISVLLNSYGKKLTPRMGKVLHDMGGCREVAEVKVRPKDNGILSFGKVLNAFKTALTIGAIFFISYVLLVKVRNIRKNNKAKGL